MVGRKIPGQRNSSVWSHLSIAQQSTTRAARFSDVRATAARGARLAARVVRSHSYGSSMNEQHSTVATADQAPAGHTQIGWGFWVLRVLALAAIGALSYVMGTQAFLAEVTLPSGAMVLCGFLAGALQGFDLR